MVQWLRLWASSAGAWVQSLVRELRSHIPFGVWPKINKERLTVANGDKDMEKKGGSLTLLAVMKNGMTTIDNRFGISYKLNIYIYITTSNSSSRNLTKRNENICVKEDLSMNVHYCLIHNCLKQEITSKSITKWLGEQISVYLINGILLSKKKVPGHRWNSQIYWAKKLDTRVNALLLLLLLLM